MLGENQKCSNDVYVRSSQRADPDTSGVLQPGVILLNFVKNLKIRDVVRARGWVRPPPTIHPDIPSVQFQRGFESEGMMEGEE